MLRTQTLPCRPDMFGMEIGRGKQQPMFDTKKQIASS